MNRVSVFLSSFVLTLAPLTSVAAQNLADGDDSEFDLCIQDCKDNYPMGEARIQCKIACIEGAGGGGQEPPPPPPGQCTTPATGWCSWD